MIRVVDDSLEFAGMRAEWDDLLSASPSDGFFLTWEWLYPWWRHLGGRRRLSLLTMRWGGELCAVAPLARALPSPRRLLPFSRVEFLGTGSAGSDYLDVIARAGREQVAAAAVAGQLVRSPTMLELDRLGRAGGVADDLAARMRESDWTVSRAPSGACPYADLSGHTWESYLASLGSEHRYAFRRKLRKLTGSFSVSFRAVRTEAERADALACLIRLHRACREGRGGSDALHTDALVAFHDEASRLALRRGWLRLYVLVVDGEAAAAVYAFRYRDRFLFYQSGYHPGLAPWSVGVVTLGLTIKAAIEEGAAEFDFLHGEEPYKSHWAREVRDLFRLEIYPPRAHGLLRRGVFDASRAARRLARRAIVLARPGAQEGGLAPRRR